MESYAIHDDLWDELLDGELVAMAPATANHTVTSTNISRILGNYFEGKPCVVYGDGLSVFLSEKDRVVPDAMVICNKEIVKRNGVYGAPDLIVEVLSRGTVKRDRGYKKDLYERSGVKEYWMIDPEHRYIETYVLKDSKYGAPEIYEALPDAPTEFPSALFSNLKMPLDKIFSNLIDD